jgi:hypothetical protein
MAEEKGNYGLLGGLLMALHPDARGTISALITFVLFGTAVYAFVAVPGFIKRLSEGAPEHCWELAEVQGAPVKFNKCTGDLKPIAKWMLAPEAKAGEAAVPLPKVELPPVTAPKVEPATH